MKFIHCADIHLGSQIKAKFPAEKSKERKTELHGAFSKLVSTACALDAKAILICGDLFDGDSPKRSEKDFFYAAVAKNPDIDFLYLRGNHDNGASYEKQFDNLKLFGKDWTKYEYYDGEKKIVICAREQGDDAQCIYEDPELDENDFNIVMLHGQISDSEGKDNIVIKKMAGKNIDFLALGHVHSYSEGKIDDRGTYCYSGCVFGRGFDETGVKGFDLIDTENGFTHEFTEIPGRIIEEKDLDISDTANIYELIKKAEEEFGYESENILRLNITGERKFDCESIEKEAENTLSGYRYFISVKDKTVRTFDKEEFLNDPTLKGEFVRKVLGCADLSEEEKNRVVSCGLKVLRGENPEL